MAKTPCEHPQVVVANSNIELRPGEPRWSKCVVCGSSFWMHLWQEGEPGPRWTNDGNKDGTYRPMGEDNGESAQP